MTSSSNGRRVLVPGGTGAVGEGIVPAFLSAGATRRATAPRSGRTSSGRSWARRPPISCSLVGPRLHDVRRGRGLAEMEQRLGGIDDVVAPIGGWWAGKKLVGDRRSRLAGRLRRARDDTHGCHAGHGAAASALGAYTLIVGASAFTPIPGSGLVSMEQAALSMMTEVVLRAEQKRAFTLVLGPVRTRVADSATSPPIRSVRSRSPPPPAGAAAGRSGCGTGPSSKPTGGLSLRRSAGAGCVAEVGEDPGAARRGRVRLGEEGQAHRVRAVVRRRHPRRPPLLPRRHRTLPSRCSSPSSAASASGPSSTCSSSPAASARSTTSRRAAIMSRYNILEEGGI